MAGITFQFVSRGPRPGFGCPDKEICSPELKELLKNKVVVEVSQPIATESGMQAPIYFLKTFGLFNTNFLLCFDGRFISFNAWTRYRTTSSADLSDADVVIVENVVHGARKINGRNATASHKTAVSTFCERTNSSHDIADEARMQLRQHIETMWQQARGSVPMGMV